MSRYIYQDYIQDGNGVIVASASIVVYLAGTTTLATIYSAESGGSAVSGSTVTSDSNGFFSFYIDTDDYAADQLFKITWSKTGYTGSSFDNLRILWNFSPSALDDYSSDDTEFQATVQVGTGASRPTSLQGELTGLRWSIAAISGTNYYESPTATISEIATSVSSNATSVTTALDYVSGRTCDYAADSGSTDAYAITLSPAPASLTAGLSFKAKLNTVNTGACTIDVNSLGATSIKTEAGADPVDGEFVANGIYQFTYDGTNMVHTGGTTPAGLKETSMNASGSAPMFAVRAWVSFDGTGTPSINGSGNVSSITDNGTGDYTVNFTTDMPNANFAVLCSFRRGDGSTSGIVEYIAKSVSAARVVTMQTDHTKIDMDDVSVAIIA